MLGTELAYVREKLGRASPSERRQIAIEIGINPKTLLRILRRETKYGRTDTIGKLSMHFRTRERRRK
jgi:hypothetical protein